MHALEDGHAELLSNAELFRGLDRVTLAKLAAHLEQVRVTAGQVIFRQGDPPDGLYLIGRGSVSIFAAGDQDASDVVLSRLGRGDAFGEIALLTGGARSATARSEEDGELLRLHQSRFHDLVRRDPSVALAISAGLIRRLRGADAARLGITHAADERADRSAPQSAPVASSRPGGRRRRPIGLGLGALVLLLGWFAAPPPDLSSAGWHALLSLTALVPLLALEALPDGATALLLVSVWVLGGIASPRAALTATNTFFMPYQSTVYLALHSGGGAELFSHHQARPLAIAYAALVVAGILVSVPVWRAIGLL